MSDKPPSVYEIECIDLQGRPMPLKLYAGRPLIVVNTASLCGFSGHFKGLEDIWRRHRENGLLMLGVPSNDFGHQEPGNSVAVAAVCLDKFGVTFPLLQKTRVKGRDTHPLFRFLTAEGGYFSRPRWNFYKYLVGRDGHLKNWFSSLTNPGGEKFQDAVSELMKS